MYSRPPSRNNRSKGIKVKHILQVCLLAALCFWLIYQVKRSHEKEKELDEKDVKLASETQSGNEILRLGRKDISRVTETITDAKVHGGDDQENEGDEEEKMHADDEKERVESRTEDTEEEAFIDKPEEEKIDDEKERVESRTEDTEEEEIIDKPEEDKIDDEIQDEHIVDEDKESEEGDEANEVNDDSEERDNEESVTMLEDHDQGREAGNIHEAREEHYKADDTKIVKHTDGHSELTGDGKENVNQSSKQPIPVKNSHAATEGANSSYSEVSDSKDNLTVPGSISSENLMIQRELIGQSQTSNDLTQSESKQSDDMIQAHNATYGTPVSLFSRANISDVASDKNQLDATSISNFTQNVNKTSEGSLGSSGEVKLTVAENITGAAEAKADDATSSKVSDNNTDAGEDESSIYDTTNDKTNSDLDDPFDDSDSSLTQEEREYPTGLGTLTDV